MFLAVGFVPTLFVLELALEWAKRLVGVEKYPLWHSLIVGLGCYLFKQQGYSSGAGSSDNTLHKQRRQVCKPPITCQSAKASFETSHRLLHRQYDLTSWMCNFLVVKCLSSILQRKRLVNIYVYIILSNPLR